VGSFLAAAVQLTSTPDPDANFVAAEEQIELAARRGAELVGLPENFAFMGEDSRRLELAPALAERCSRFLVTMARRYQVTLLGGGFPVPAGAGKTFNRAELVGTTSTARGASSTKSGATAAPVAASAELGTAAVVVAVGVGVGAVSVMVPPGGQRRAQRTARPTVAAELVFPPPHRYAVAVPAPPPVRHLRRVTAAPPPVCPNPSA